MRKAVAITHVPFEDLGSLENELTHAGYEIEFVDACTGELGAVSRSPPELLVCLGGPIGVHEREAYPFVNVEVELIRARLDAKRPTIGICLGATVSTGIAQIRWRAMATVPLESSDEVPHGRGLAGLD